MGLRDVATDLDPQYVAEMLRQQHGISLEQKDRKPIGYGEEMSARVKRIESEFAVPPPPEKYNERYDNLELMRLWLMGREPGLTTLNWERDKSGMGELRLGEVASLRQMVLGAVKKLFEGQAIEPPRALTKETQMQRMGGVALGKLQFIRQQLQESAPLGIDEANDPATQLADVVEEGIGFLQDDLGVGASEAQEEYKQKWARVIEGGDRPGLTSDARAKRKLRALLLFRRLSQGRAKELSRVIYDDMMQLASAKNFYELVKLMGVGRGKWNIVEMFRRNGEKRDPVNFAQVKTKVGEIMQGEGSKEQLVGLIKQIGGITKFIRKAFPHDHAYLLGQALSRRQAVCAGKELMFGMILENLGLAPQYVGVDVLNNNDFTGGHVVTQIAVGEYVVEWDLNCRAANNEQEEAAGCSVNILRLEKREVMRPEKGELLALTKGQYRRARGEYQYYKLVWGERPHKVVSVGELSADYLDYSNLANLLSSREFNEGKPREEQERNRGEAVKLYRRAIELEPDEPGYKNNLADLLSSREFNEGKPREEQERNREEAARLYRRAIELKPDEPGYKKNYYIHLEESIKELTANLSDAEKKRMYQEAIEYGEMCIEANYWPGDLANMQKRIEVWRGIVDGL